MKFDKVTQRQINQLSDKEKEAFFYWDRRIHREDLIMALYSPQYMRKLIDDYEAEIDPRFRFLREMFNHGIADRLEEAFLKFDEDDRYKQKSNFRCAEIGNIEQERLYEEIKNEKSCSYDDIIDVYGKKYKIGFDYED